MNTNQLMTGAAVGLAAFALYQFTKRPGGAILATQPAQQQRDAGLQSWFGSLMEPGYFSQGATAYNALTMSTLGAIAPTSAALPSFASYAQFLNRNEKSA